MQDLIPKLTINNVVCLSLLSSIIWLAPKVNGAVLDSHAKRWPKNTVYYQLDNTGTAAAKKANSLFMKASENIASLTNIKFIQGQSKDGNFVQLTSREGDGCSSETGMIAGGQTLSLSGACVTLRAVKHEIMHVLGFGHEHQAPGREHYIKINQDNIVTEIPGVAVSAEEILGEFAIDEQMERKARHSDYDYSSITHQDPYHPRLSKDTSKPIMESLDPERPIRFEDELSKLDIYMINLTYPSNERDARPAEPPPLELSVNELTLKPEEYKIVKIYQPLPTGRVRVYNLSSETGINVEADPPGRVRISASAAFNKPQRVKFEYVGGGKRDSNSPLSEQTLTILPGGNPTVETDAVAETGLFHQWKSRADGLCLQVLEDGYSWFWENGKATRTVGMRTCDANVEEQYWKYLADDKTLVNKADQTQCLAKVKLDSDVVAPNERSYVALQRCDSASPKQQWQLRSTDQANALLAVKLQNVADQDLTLMQGNGTVVVQYGDSEHYFWDLSSVSASAK